MMTLKSQSLQFADLNVQKEKKELHIRVCEDTAAS